MTTSAGGASPLTADLRLITVPYHDGRHTFDRGLGPDRLAGADLLARLRAQGWSAGVEEIPTVDEALPEAARVFACARGVAGRVCDAREAGAFPVVLAGDCNACLGVAAGVGTSGLGVLWLDAHADVDTPRDSDSGSLDAMGLSLLTGRGWRALRASVPGLAPVPEAHVLLVGARDLAPHQRRRLEASGIVRLAVDAEPAAVDEALDGLRARTPRLYVHLDLDALDPTEGVANRYAAAGGLSAESVLAILDRAFARFAVAAVAVTAYEPAVDRDGRMRATAHRLLVAIGTLALGVERG